MQSFFLLLTAISAASPPVATPASNTSSLPIKASSSNITEAHTPISGNATNTKNTTLPTSVSGNATNTAKITPPRATDVIKGANSTNLTISGVNGTLVNSTRNGTSGISSDATKQPIKATS
ncbi:hypothetical protein DSO57_1004392 [Entomophthora muscae]|uniref:Uncharacterized protein n=2 Tax=Entomophthora muscae TaxID=34485 RepID=A0ACC2SX95_9FUNG|nr:hypothetical protein DSO57_1038403 [Entomophthora muscae]KAJ9066963.1 hypothetical protein DSO57_1004392 [Entomophthora muscae]